MGGCNGEATIHAPLCVKMPREFGGVELRLSTCVFANKLCELPCIAQAQIKTLPCHRVQRL